MKHLDFLSRLALSLVILITPFLSLGQGIPLPYTTGFDDPDQQDGWVQYRLGEAQPSYLWEFSTVNPYSPPTQLSHNYPVGGMNATDDWFVSPVFNLTYGGTVDSVYHAYEGFGLPQPEDTIALYLLTGHPHPDSATSKTMLHLFSDSTYQNDGQWRVTTNLLIPAGDTQSYVAFRYKTVNNWLDVRFDNVTLRGNIVIPSVGVDRTASSVRLAVQPVTDFLEFKADQSLPCNLEVFNMTGQCLMDRSITLGERVPVALPSGVYVYRLTSDDRMFQSGKFVVQ